MGGWVSRVGGAGGVTRRCCRGRGRGAAGLSKHCNGKRGPYRDGRAADRRRCRSDGWRDGGKRGRVCGGCGGC